MHLTQKKKIGSPRCAEDRACFRNVNDGHLKCNPCKYMYIQLVHYWPCTCLSGMNWLRKKNSTKISACYCFKECLVSPSHWAQDLTSATKFICDHIINVDNIRDIKNDSNPLAPLSSRNRRYPLILLYTSAGTALVSKKYLCMTVGTPSTYSHKRWYRPYT